MSVLLMNKHENIHNEERTGSKHRKIGIHPSFDVACTEKRISFVALGY